MHIQKHTGTFFHHFHSILDNRQGTETQEIHFQKSQLFQCCHGKLRDNGTILCSGKGYVFRYILLADHNTCRMHGGMPRKPLQTFCQIDQTMDIVLFLVSLAKLRIHSQCLVNGDIQLLWNHLGDGVHLGIRHIQNTAYITNDTAGCQCTEGNDLNHAVITIFSSYIINNLLSPFEAKIHIDIRHGYSLRIQETFKEQIIPDRVQLGDPKCIGNQASCGRASSRTDHDIVVPGIFDKIPYNEKVIYISHVFDRRQLIIQALFQLLCYRMITLLKSLMAKLVQIFPGGKSVRHIIFRQLGHTKFNLHMTSLRDPVRIFQRFQRIWKKPRHLLRRFHIILATLIAHSVLIAELFLSLQTKKNIMWFRILCHSVMHIIGGNQIDPRLSVHTEKLLVYGLLLRDPMVLKLQKEISFSENILVT